MKKAMDYSRIKQSKQISVSCFMKKTCNGIFKRRYIGVKGFDDSLDDETGRFLQLQATVVTYI
jgi:hypothetical protein